jgi:hypothetical protein
VLNLRPLRGFKSPIPYGQGVCNLSWGPIVLGRLKLTWYWLCEILIRPSELFRFRIWLLKYIFGYLVRLPGWKICPSQGHHLHRQHNPERRRHTSMPRAGLEPTIPAFERSKTVRTLDRAAIGAGCWLCEFVISQTCDRKFTSLFGSLWVRGEAGCGGFWSLALSAQTHAEQDPMKKQRPLM